MATNCNCDTCEADRIAEARASLKARITELEAETAQLRADNVKLAGERNDLREGAVALYRQTIAKLIGASFTYDPASREVFSEEDGDPRGRRWGDAGLATELEGLVMQLRRATASAAVDAGLTAWRMLVASILDLQGAHMEDGEMRNRLSAHVDDLAEAATEAEEVAKTWRTWGETVAGVLPGEDRKISSPDLRLRIAREYQARLRLAGEWRHWAERQASLQASTVSNGPMLANEELREYLGNCLKERARAAHDANEWWTWVCKVLEVEGHARPADADHARKLLSACFDLWRAYTKGFKEWRAWGLELMGEKPDTAAEDLDNATLRQQISHAKGSAQREALAWWKWALVNCEGRGFSPADSVQARELLTRIMKDVAGTTLPKMREWQRSAIAWQDWAIRVLGIGNGVQIDSISRNAIEQQLKDLRTQVDVLRSSGHDTWIDECSHIAPEQWKSAKFEGINRHAADAFPYRAKITFGGRKAGKTFAGKRAREERERLGRLVRQVWLQWAIRQPNPKPSWLFPWEKLSEADREVDRLIADAIAADVRQAGMRRRFELRQGLQRVSNYVRERLRNFERIEGREVLAIINFVLNKNGRG